MKKECNSVRRQFVNKLADELKTSSSPKPFWNFVQSKRKVKSDPVSLKVDNSYRMTPNMHLHTHLVDCILDFGLVCSFWLFSFEQYNDIMELTRGQLK